MADCASLERMCGGNSTEGSNPSLSAIGYGLGSVGREINHQQKRMSVQNLSITCPSQRIPRQKQHVNCLILCLIDPHRIVRS